MVSRWQMLMTVATVGGCLGVAGSAAPAPAAAVATPATAVVRSGAVTRTFVADPGGEVAGRAALTQRARADRSAREAALTEALDALGNDEFAVAVVDRKTGRTYTYRGSLRFQTASVMKVDILSALLLRAQDAGRHLTSSERALATRMIRASDNAAASALWDEVGGHDGLVAANRRLKLTQTTPGYDDLWGTTTTTVADQVKLLDTVTVVRAGGVLTEYSVNYLLGLMRTVDADQRWGVSAAARSGERVAIKNGWMTGPTSLSEWTINSIGRVTGAGTDLTIAVLSQANTSMEDGVYLVETVVRLARQRLGW